MHKNIYRLVLVILPFFLSSCAGPRFTDSPYEPLTMEAIKQFYTLKASGKLPGLSKDEHGNVQTEAIPTSGPITYPVSVVLHVTTASNHADYGYIFTKAGQSSEWRLTRAWQQQVDGKSVDFKIQ